MHNPRPCDEVFHGREQIRDALLVAFNNVIRDSRASDSDEMAGRTLLDVVAYVISFKVPTASLDDRAEIRAFTRNETLRFEMYLREHLLRRAESDTLTIADGEDVPKQPTGGDDGV